jgi:hypothetical protein
MFKRYLRVNYIALDTKDSLELIVIILVIKLEFVWIVRLCVTLG